MPSITDVRMDALPHLIYKDEWRKVSWCSSINCLSTSACFCGLVVQRAHCIHECLLVLLLLNIISLKFYALVPLCWESRYSGQVEVGTLYFQASSHDKTPPASLRHLKTDVHTNVSSHIWMKIVDWYQVSSPGWMVHLVKPALQKSSLKFFTCEPAPYCAATSHRELIIKQNGHVTWQQLQNKLVPCHHYSVYDSIVHTQQQQLFYGPFSGTTWVSRCQKKTSGLCGARED